MDVLFILRRSAMFEIAKFQMPESATSAFMPSDASQDSRRDMWAEAGRSIELAYCGPLPIGMATRAVIALAIVAAAKLCTTAAL